MSKAIRLTILAPLALACLCGSAPAEGGVTNSTKNRQQIAILRWYEGNQTANFAVGQSAVGVAFDGTNIWVTNREVQLQTVTKLRPSDGILCQPDCPGQVMKVRASDGLVLGSFNVRNEPDGVVFDGANIWVANTFSGYCNQAARPRWLRARDFRSKRPTPGRGL
jgi:hypothetical protein